MKDTANFRRIFMLVGAVLLAVKDFDLTIPFSDNIKWNFNILGFIILALGLIWDFASTYETQERKVALLITPVLNIISSILGAATGSEIRIGLFLLEKKYTLFRKPDRVRIYFHSSNMDKAPDLSLRFEKRQGLVGHVWASREPASADLTIVQGQNGYWNMDQAQIALSSNLRAIYGTPIIDSTDDDKLIGILVFDTTSVYLHSNPRRGRLFNYFSNNMDFQKTVPVVKEWILITLKYFNFIRILE